MANLVTLYWQIEHKVYDAGAKNTTKISIRGNSNLRFSIYVGYLEDFLSKYKEYVIKTSPINQDYPVGDYTEYYTEIKLNISKKKTSLICYPGYKPSL